MKKLLVIISVLVMLCGCSANVDDVADDLDIDGTYTTYTDASGKHSLQVTKDGEDFNGDCIFSFDDFELTGTIEMENNKGEINFDGITSMLGTDSNLIVVYKDEALYLTGGFMVSPDGENYDDSQSVFFTDEKFTEN